MEWTKQELIQKWMNTEKRRQFLKDYKAWGVWLTVPELGLTYYKYKLPGSGRLLAMEYQHQNPYYQSYGGEEFETTVINYLWEGEYFIPNPASEYGIIERFKKLKAEFQKELRSQS